VVLVVAAAVLVGIVRSLSRRQRALTTVAS
jgi:hypothetical protein